VENVDKATRELRKALAGKDIKLIKAKSEALAKILGEVGMPYTGRFALAGERF
jgi:hypothetical protein